MNLVFQLIKMKYSKNVNLEVNLNMDNIEKLLKELIKEINVQNQIYFNHVKLVKD